MFEQFFRTFLMDISLPLQQLLVSVTVALIGLTSAYVNKLYQSQKAKLSMDQQFFLDIAVQKAIAAVEQMYFSEPSNIKKAKAIELVQNFLKQASLDIDVKVIDTAIESAVFGSSFTPKKSKG